MTDALSFLSPKASKLISDGHIFVYRKLPRLFGKAYEYEEKHPPKLIYKSMALATEPLYNRICENKYDTVICTHVFAAMMMTEIKKQYNTDIKTYFIATDYTCSPGVSDIDTDVFFTPHALLSEEFIKKGVPAEKIVPAGIPIKDEFFLPCDRAEARKLLDFPENARILLLSSGSMGAGPIFDIAYEIAKGLDADSYLAVICGTNEKLYKKLENAMKRLPNVRVLGYTDKIRYYMAAADLFLTKPGGLSTTEAFYQRLPTIAIDAVPGCETRNLDFFDSNGLAERARNARAVASLALSRLSDSDYLSKMSKNMASLFSGNPTQDICDTVINSSNKEETNP